MTLLRATETDTRSAPGPAAEPAGPSAIPSAVAPATGPAEAPERPAAQATGRPTEQAPEPASSQLRALRLALKASRIGVFDIRLPEGQGQFSDDCLEVLGYGAEYREAFLRGFSPLVHPQDRAAMLRSRHGTRAQDANRFEMEARRMRCDGSYGWVRCVGQVVERDGPDAGLRMVGTLEDVNGWRRAEAELRQARQQLQALSEHVETRLEAERKLIASEVHDQCGQVLTLVKMEVAALRSAARQAPLMLDSVQRLDELVNDLVQLSRDVIARLRPPALDLGLVPALEWLAGEWARQTGMDCKFSCAVDDLALPDDKATTLFRIVQESLTNAGRHAQASRVHVRLAVGADGLDLLVADNGCGFDTGADRSGRFGILGMQERAQRAGGRLEVTSTPGTGTQVRVSLPLSAAAVSAAA
jgi:signal transduction histidine kinase